MKKSLLTLLTAILIGSSFTSCIENTVPDEVTAIYAGQANVLAAEAALLNAQANLAASETARAAAEAAFLEAQARAEDARSAALTAQAAIDQAMAEAQIAAMAAQTAIDQAESAAAIAAAEAAAAQQAAESDARIAAMIAAMENANAQAAADLALAEIAQQQAAFALQQAQELFAAEMAAMAREIAAAELAATTAAEAATAAAIQAAFSNYITEKSQLDGLTSTEAANQLAILQHMRTMAEDVLTDEATFNQLVANVSIEEADLVVLQGMLADYQALLAPGTTLGDRIALRNTYQATIDANLNLIHDLNTEVAMLTEADAAAWDVLDASGYNQVELDLNVLRNQYQTARVDAENARNNSATATAQSEVIAENIARLQDIVDNYDTKLADFEAAVASAEGVTATATAAEAAAAAAQTAAEEAIVAANADLADAQAALVTVQAAEAAALTTLNDAVDAYVTALQGEQDTTGAEAVVTAAETALTAAQATYNAAKTAFDADPTGSIITPGEPGPDGILGDFTDTSAITFREITDINISGEATLATAEFDALPTGEAATTSTWDNFIITDIGKFYDVEADDTASSTETKAERLQDAATALDAARLAVVSAQAALKVIVDFNAALDVPGALETYNAATAFYETAQAQVTTAEGVVATAEAAITAAVAAEVTAAAAHDAAIAALADAVADTAAANAALTAFENSTEIEYQNELEAALVEQDVNAAEIATQDALFIELDALAKELAATIDAGPDYTAEQMAAKDAYDAASAALSEKISERVMLINENNSLQTYINLIDITESFNIEAMISNLELSISSKEASIVNAQALVDNFSSNTAENNLRTLEFLEANLANTQLRIETQQLVVDQMKAILDSLL
ncbi:hypothetical protein K8354_10610 [Polaribacter litorisediminis]|uniref:hypothetical protein n=1 Tax=Polaribacter litorisediminis TaxID=1908341 RepID=UPI001CBFEBBD|nr:hypothetical protein [Polaribacter litorisediminis]UAM96782.1 hypothetical protein K8354_10610 [Polaribacter litorisediminis]